MKKKPDKKYFSHAGTISRRTGSRSEPALAGEARAHWREAPALWREATLARRAF
jgi:hypothetical protein